jgi:hypothetical protein
VSGEWLLLLGAGAVAVAIWLFVRAAWRDFHGDDDAG